MPAFPFFQINEIFCFVENFFIPGIKIILKKILLKKVLFFLFPDFFLFLCVDLLFYFFDNRMEIIRIYRFQNVFCHTIADCLLCKRKITISTEDHHLQVRFFFFCLPGQFQPIHVRHFYVRKKQLNLFCAENLKCLFSIGSFEDFSFSLSYGQQILQTFSFNFFIIYNKDMYHTVFSST